MSIFTSFVAVGLICAVASIIYDLTKLTPGHITSLFVVIGGFLSTINLYDKLIEKYGYGLALPITSFGNSLVNASYKGYLTNGPYGILDGMLKTTSAGISAVIIFSFFIAIFCKPKD